MNLFFEKGFKNISHFLGFLRGFDDIAEDSDLQNSWQDFVQENNVFDSKFLNSLKSEFFEQFDEKNETLEQVLYKMLKEYFESIHNIEFH